MQDRFDQVLFCLADCSVKDLYYPVLERIDKTLLRHSIEHVVKSGGGAMAKERVWDVLQIRQGKKVIPMGCQGSRSCTDRCGKLVVGVWHRCFPWFVSDIRGSRD